MKIPKNKTSLILNAWLGDSILLTLLFSWLLLYPMHGFFLHRIFGPDAVVLAHLFTVSHGLGLILFGFLSMHMSRNKSYIQLAGVAVFVLTFIWTVFPQSGSLNLLISSLLGFCSAYLVLAWTSNFMVNTVPELTLGTSMALTNVLLCLIGFAYYTPETALKIAAAFTGTAPLLCAFYITRRPSEIQSNIATEQNKIKVGLRYFLGISFLAAAAYFSGGLWYRSVLPIFYSQWPGLMGIDSIIYAFAVFTLAFFVKKYSLYWLGIISLSTLGIGLAISAIGLSGSTVLAITVVFLSIGLGALDLFFWLTLRRLAFFIGNEKAFGFGLGISLFFITAPGIAIDTGVLANPLLSPVVSVIGACLLFLANPLLVQLVQSLTLPTNEQSETKKDNKTAPHYPEFWQQLTNSEKNVYELICKGWTDAEIAADLVISRHTVKFHVRNILRKAGVSNRKEMLAQLIASQQIIKD